MARVISPLRLQNKTSSLTTWGCIGMLFPLNITAGDSNGYLLGNLNLSLNVSPSYNVSAAPIKSIVHLKNKRLVNIEQERYTGSVCSILTLRYRPLLSFCRYSYPALDHLKNWLILFEVVLSWLRQVVFFFLISCYWADINSRT